MKKISSITILGVLILIISSPFIAIPIVWKGYVLMFLGLLTVIFSLALRKELHKVLKVLHGDDVELIKDTYVENNPQ